jgi:hypothetical protein
MVADFDLTLFIIAIDEQLEYSDLNFIKEKSCSKDHSQQNGWS